MPMPFDTLAYAEQLKRAGFTDDQARALAELRLDVSEAKRDIETLKVGRPASAEELRQLERQFIPIENLYRVWPLLGAYIIFGAAIVAVLIIGLVMPAPK